ncbi:MAG: hypothetical protein LBG59_04690 [Candidatus Peribacteria bacterium]|jgi:hypothetical protein|nr:hypothetical protein [Candidatus Peribacteria bacterium]
MIETGKEKNANIPQLQVTCRVKYVDYELLTTEKVEELRKSDYYTTQDHIDTFVFSFLSDTLPKEKIKEFKDAYRGLIYEIFLNIQQHAARTSQNNEVKVDISCEILKNAYDEQVLQMKVRDYGP